MAEFLNGMKRTHMCGELRGADAGKTVTVMGWVAKYRDIGSLFFSDLRDRTGIVQIAFDDTNKELLGKAAFIKNEYVLAVSGKVRSRGTNINKDIPTGGIEILVTELKILSESEVTPFVITDEASAKEELRLKYRYLDLRRPSLQKNLIMRNKITHSVHNFMAENGFMEIETPFLGKSTPEGARDYLVPSRIHTGKFYALPQSPQLFKQLLMISGYDRYYQIARCFRDEDLRSNRQPEFTQIDLEMSFVDTEDDVMDIAEDLIKRIFADCLNMKFKDKFRRMTYREAKSRYGSDKPDTRFGLELNDITDIVGNSQFSVFSDTVMSGGWVLAVNAKGFTKTTSRKEIDAICEKAKTFGAKGLAWIALKEDGTTSSVLKFLSEEEIKAIYERTKAETGDIIFIIADKMDKAFDIMGNVRLHLGEIGGLIDKNKFDILWITEFPMFEYDEEEKRYFAKHHPFTAPNNNDIHLLYSDMGNVRAKAYDLVINGQEAGGGSVRIYRRDIQELVFRLLGFTKEDIEKKFGFFVDAFKYGTPPHGGLAFGLDRLVMLLTGTDNIKDVIAFPKVQNASCLMSQAPGEVEDKQLKELGLCVK